MTQGRWKGHRPLGKLISNTKLILDRAALRCRSIGKIRPDRYPIDFGVAPGLYLCDDPTSGNTPGIISLFQRLINVIFFIGLSWETLREINIESRNHTRLLLFLRRTSLRISRGKWFFGPNWKPSKTLTWYDKRKDWHWIILKKHWTRQIWTQHEKNSRYHWATREKNHTQASLMSISIDSVFLLEIFSLQLRESNAFFQQLAICGTLAPLPWFLVYWQVRKAVSENKGSLNPTVRGTAAFLAPTKSAIAAIAALVWNQLEGTRTIFQGARLRFAERWRPFPSAICSY